MLVEKLLPSFNYRNGILHCHDWHTAACLLYAKARKLKIATVFTLHSTVLGDSLRASANFNINKINFEPENEAYKNNIEAKYHLEKAASANSNLFSTVSESVALEAIKLLNINPKIILDNGIENRIYPNLDELTVKAELARTKLREFVSYYFYPYYHFDFSNTQFYLIESEYDSKELN